MLRALLAQLLQVRVSKDGLRPEFPPQTPQKFRALAEQCWQGDRRARPSFRLVGGPGDIRSFLQN